MMVTFLSFLRYLTEFRDEDANSPIIYARTKFEAEMESNIKQLFMPKDQHLEYSLCFASNFASNFALSFTCFSADGVSAPNRRGFGSHPLTACRG